MTPPPSFFPGALQELHEAFDWYAERNAALAEDLANQVQAALERIADFPDAGRPLGNECRMVALSRFPYQVVYLREQGHLFIIAIAHTSRRPGYWSDRLPPA